MAVRRCQSKGATGWICITERLLRVCTDDQAKLPTEGFAQGFAFPGEASATNVTLPTPEGSPEAKRLSYHEPGESLS